MTQRTYHPSVRRPKFGTPSPQACECATVPPCAPTALQREAAAARVLVLGAHASGLYTAGVRNYWHEPTPNHRELVDHYLGEVMTLAMLDRFLDGARARAVRS